MLFVDAAHPQFSYMGRISFERPAAPMFYYAGSQVSICFTGENVSAVIRNFNAYGEINIGYVLDGVQGSFTVREGDGSEEYVIATDLSPEIHTLIIYKMQDATHRFEFLGINVDDDSLLVKKSMPNRRMECYGDSICAGAVCEAQEYVGKLDPENHNNHYDNAWYSFPMQAARILNAQLYNNSQGGLALFDNTGYFDGPEFVGLETTYDKLCYFRSCGYTSWDFTRYIPHVVIIEIGQNDNHAPENKPEIDINLPENRDKWKEGYKKLVRKLRGHYPKAHFVICTSLLFHDIGRDTALDEICAELEDDRVHRLIFTRNGAGTPGHPRISENSEMAAELVMFINNLGDSIWED